VRADGNQRIACNLADLIPAQAFAMADFADIDVLARRKVADGFTDFLVGLAPHQPVIDAGIDAFLLGNVGAFDALLAAIHQHQDFVGLCNHLFEHLPLQFSTPVRKTGRQEHRERRVVLFEYLGRPLLVIGVTAVEGEADEPALEVALRQAAMHFVERNNVDLPAAEMTERSIQKTGGNFQIPVRLECGFSPWPNMVNGKYSACTSQQRPR